MYMRYYPRQLRPLKRLQVPFPDKGRKHYWGHDKSDYGIYTSEDQQQIRKMNNTYRKSRHHRSHTIDAGNMNRDGDWRYENIANLEGIKPEKTVDRFENPQEVKLPSISRISKQTQTVETESLKKHVKFEQDPQPPTPKLQKQQSERKYKTQQDQPPFTPYNYNNNQISFEPGTRFSPTFVCSVLNPLPSYIIQPHQYRSLQYTRVTGGKKDRIYTRRG